MSHPITVIAILPVKSGKSSRLLECLNDVAGKAEASESNCLAYQVYQAVSEAGVIEDIVMIEKYADQAALDDHLTKPYVGGLLKAFNEEDLLSGPPVMKRVAVIGGFEGR